MNRQIESVLFMDGFQSVNIFQVRPERGARSQVDVLTVVDLNVCFAIHEGECSPSQIGTFFEQSHIEAKNGASHSCGQTGKSAANYRYSGCVRRYHRLIS